MISSIGNRDAVLSPQLLPISQSRPEANEKIASNDRNGNSLPAKAPPPSQKRKAEEILPRPNEKALKGSGYRGSSSMLSSHTTSQQSTQTPKPTTSNPSAQGLPNRGLNKTPVPAPPTTAAPKLPPPDGSKAPKKGSFAEIMARAKAAQEAPPAVGIIKHQPKDKKALSNKKELMLQKKGRLGKSQAPNGHSRNSSGDLSSGSASKLSGRPGVASAKKVPDPAYRGTAQAIAKPKPQIAYKGTMGGGKSSSQSSQKKPLPRAENGRPTASRYRYDSYSEGGGSGTEGEEEEDYDSDDMEAGFDDVEEEETKATKQAKKDDAREAMIEAELKKLPPEARKRRLQELRLQELAEKQRAKKPVY